MLEGNRRIGMENGMRLAAVSARGQITLPAEFRRQLGIRSKGKVRLWVKEGEIVIRPLNSFRDLRGALKPKSEDSRMAAGEAAAKHVMETD
ncbi:MAG: AbrB/MazE/SpoVT family DNA-binding domain-containing protein [Deltaproteobacteria bacterium]|nr:AbrB/MazE/SpoVT family DNA-binding domain-containing protein [Deltaproteobacteria bacterium]MBW1815569.1 AbrB/MazE/SpoVT family DNA-binding domain-containing protein [Deltaproteobacteria bacterium]